MWEVMAAVFSAAAVLLGIVILFRLPKNQNDGVTYDQLRRGMAEQSNDTMRQLSLLKQELDTAMKNTVHDIDLGRKGLEAGISFPGI